MSRMIMNHCTGINSSLNISGTTSLCGATTWLSSLNITGNIIGSGTALTYLNYNAITNKTDLTVYATSSNSKSLSSTSTLSINNLIFLHQHHY